MIMNIYHSSHDIVRELKQQRDKNLDLYIPVPVQPGRTLLLMGPTRAGKSTISRALRDSLYEPERPTIYSATRRPEPQQIAGLRIIDMPGFNDLQTLNRSTTLSNMAILDMLQKELHDNDPVHLVAFVFSLSDGIKQEDIDAMLFVQSNLPQLAEKTMLVMTHGEELNNEDKDQLVEEFFNHPRVKQFNLQNFFQKDILFVGCLRYESFNQRNYKALVNEHQNVLEMRKTFIEKCFEEIPAFNNQQVINSYASSRPIHHYVFAIVMIWLIFSTIGRYIDVSHTSADPGSKSNLSANSVNVSITKNDIELNKTVENQPNVDKNMELNISPDNYQDHEHALSSNINETSDDAANNSTLDTTIKVEQFEANSTTEKLLYMILLQIKEFTQEIKTQSNELAAIKRHLNGKKHSSNKDKA